MAHAWRFFRSGGVDQVQLTTGRDLLALRELDQKLWVALACPVKGLEFDQRTLELIDTDGDGRVRAPELIEAVEWAGSVLSDPEQLVAASDVLPLQAIDTSKPEGKQLHATAAALLASLGKPDASGLALGDVAAAIDAFHKSPWNGDGVVPVASASDEALQAVVTDVLACTATPDVDKSGEPGISAASVAAFYEALAAYIAWMEAGSAEGVRVLGDATEGAYGAFLAVEAKIDDWFARARVAAYDSRALTAVNREEAEYLAIAAKDLHVSVDEVAHFPLAQVSAEAVLSLSQGINPAWADRVDAFLASVVHPILGDDTTSLDLASWTKLRRAFDAWRGWAGSKAGDAVAALGLERARTLASDDTRAALDALIARDEAERPQAEAFLGVEKLTRFARDLHPLANNFVSFRNFYARKGPAIFQVGTLFLDKRSCELCVDVTDAGRHGSMAPMSGAYLLYCNLKHASGKTRQIAAAVTDGDVDNLMVGRNGLFYDRDGEDWDATVTKIVANPISVRQAFWTPYKRFVASIEGMINARAAAAEKASDAKVAGAAASVQDATAGAPKAPEKSMFDVGTVAALGVAVGGITAALGAFLGALFGLGMWMPIGFAGIILIISGPSMLLAWLKLRQRNLGPLLDANGWAVNAQAKVNVPLGKSLTQIAELPKGSARDLADPFAEKRRPWGFYAFLLVLLGLAFGWYLGSLDGMLPASVRSVEVLGDAAPAHVTVPVETPEAAPVE